jgi:hypothetical protein
MLPEEWLEYAMNGREPVVTANRDTLHSPHNCYKAAAMPSSGLRSQSATNENGVRTVRCWGSRRSLVRRVS